MFQDAFVKIDRKESKMLLAEINPQLQGADFDSQNVTILGRHLTFYPGYRYLDVADYETMPHFRKHVIYKPGSVTVLDGTNMPFYRLNDQVPLYLTEATVIDYAGFFIGHVRVPQGRFTVVETVDDMPWREDPPPAARKALGRMILPVSIREKTADGAYRLDACLQFAAALYNVSIDIDAAGRVVIGNQSLLVDDLPMLDEILGQ